MNRVLLLAALSLLAALALAPLGCDSSANAPEDAGYDGGYQPTATCNGEDSECVCQQDSDCVLSYYPRDVSRSQECFCVAACAYNPVRADADSSRASAFHQYCEGGAVTDAGCENNQATCQDFTALCYLGRCAAQAPAVSDAGSGS